MEKTLTTNDVKSLLDHVIITIDRWWVENTDCKKGKFARLIIHDSPVTYKDYVEWRYSERADYEDYVSIFISLEYEYEYGEDCINIAFKTMKDGVYTEYDPFCEICEGKTGAVFSEQTGFDSDNIMHDVLTDQDIYVLTNTIADTVHKFVTPPDEDKPAEYDDADSDMMAFDSCSATEYAMNHEENASVNMDDVSKTLSIHDIQDRMIKAIRIMIVDRDTVNELTRLGSEYFVHDLSPTKCKDMLGYKIDVTPKNVVTRIVYGDDYTLCIFTCEPDMYWQHEFIIRYNSCDTGFQYKQGFNILYKNPDDYCFEYAGDGLNVEKVFKPFVDILRNTLNYELYQQLTKSKEETMDTETKAPAIKPGLIPKEVFVLDTSYFVVGDIYLLKIDPVYDWSKISTTPVKVPRQVYAICESISESVISFMIGGIDGCDQLFIIPVHADEIEGGLIAVKRVLTNESLIQNEDEGCNGYER